MTEPRFVFVGVGAVGGSIAGLVAQTKAPIAMVARGEHGRAISENGLQLKLFDRSLTVDADCYPKIGDVDWQPNDIVVLATKLNDAESAFDDLRECCGEKLTVVCATNGLAGEDFAASRFESVVAMMVWLPATHLKPGKVMLHSETPRGVLDVGIVRGNPQYAADIATCLCAAGFDSKVREDILAWKRAKWITNLGGAAQALIEDDWESVLQAAQAEGEKVLEASGLERVPTETLLNRCKHVSMTQLRGFERQGGSTWQSQHRGKPLESPFIEGAMAKLGERHGIPVPINRFLADASRKACQIPRSDVPGC